MSDASKAGLRVKMFGHDATIMARTSELKRSIPLFPFRPHGLCMRGGSDSHYMHSQTPSWMTMPQT